MKVVAAFVMLVVFTFAINMPVTYTVKVESTTGTVSVCRQPALIYLYELATGNIE